MAVSCSIPPMGKIECSNVRKGLQSVKVDKNGNAYDANNNYLGVIKGYTDLVTKETFWTIEGDNK